METFAQNRIESLFERFTALYRGRERGIWERGPAEASEKNGAFLADQTLTLERFREHLSGAGRSYGLNLLDARNRVRFCMYDMDAYPRNAPRAEMLQKLRELKPRALQLRDALRAAGIGPDRLLLEFSGTGFHFWMFYADPQPAAEVKDWMAALLRRAGLKGVPFKPQRTEATDSHAGDKVWLPLRINSNQGSRSVFIRNLDRFDPGGGEDDAGLDLLEAVRPIAAEELARLRRELGPPLS